MTGRSHWRRVTRREVCPVCGKPDWCLVIGPAGAMTAAICARVESPKPAGKAGWLHKLADDNWRPAQRRIITFGNASALKAKVPDLARLAARYAEGISSDHLQVFAELLGVSATSLLRLAIGWAADSYAWSFPMSNASGKIVGIRLRAINGRKFSVTGGHEGLFIPSGLKIGSGPLLVCEGPTDCVALLDLGFAAVGRPSCTGGVAPLCDLVANRRPSEVVIVADADAPGLRGAESLADILLAYSQLVRVITPPSPHKDARAWTGAGATTADVRALIAAAPARRLNITIT